MRILITGASSGIGKALAMGYAQTGHQVLACGRNKERLQQLSAASPAIQTLCFDLTKPDSYPCVEDETPLDLLILNAGDCAYIDNPVAFDAALFERVININLIAVAYALQTWLQHLRPGGRVVLISSSAGMLPLPRAEAYGTSKAALTYLARTLSITLRPHEIDVTLVHPGFVESPLTDKNTFKMPMIITSEKAAMIIIKGISKGKHEINFPVFFILVMRALALLPRALWRRIATRMT